MDYNDDISYPENLASRIEYTIPVTGIYYAAVFVSPWAAWGPGSYEIRILAKDDYGNSQTEEPQPLTTDGTEVSGQLESPGDEDWFRFDVEAGRR